jgi:hypothetical protein
MIIRKHKSNNIYNNENKKKEWNGDKRVKKRTFLRRPEVPGFCPSKGVVSMRETLKSTMVT